MSYELKSCPFCGGEVSIALAGSEDSHYFFITRGSGENACGCRVFMESRIYEDGNEKDIEDKKRELVKSWNTRKPMEKIVEQLEETKHCLDLAKKQMIIDYVYVGCEHLDKAIEIVEKGGME